MTRLHPHSTLVDRLSHRRQQALSQPDMGLQIYVPIHLPQHLRPLHGIRVCLDVEKASRQSYC